MRHISAADLHMTTSNSNVAHESLERRRPDSGPATEASPFPPRSVAGHLSFIIYRQEVSP